MKKLLFVLLVATTLVSCTKTNLEDDHENEVQIIDKANYEVPKNG